MCSRPVWLELSPRSSSGYLDHVLPEIVLPLHKVLAVADDLLGTQPPVSSQGYKAEVQMGCFLVHVDNGREKGIRALPALQEFQGVFEIRLDLAVRLALEKLWAGSDKSLHHSHTVLADTAISSRNHAVGFFPVPALRLHQMEVVAAPAHINIRVAGVLLLGALVVGFDGADGRPLILLNLKMPYWAFIDHAPLLWGVQKSVRTSNNLYGLYSVNRQNKNDDTL